MMADEKTFTKDELDAAVKAATDKLDDKIEELTNKYSGAMDDLKKAQREARAAKDIKPEDLAAAEDRADKAEAKVKELEKTAKDATTAKEKAEKALQGEIAFTHKQVAENGLREQLTAAGVTNAAHQKGAIAILLPQIQVSTDGDNRIAKAGDKALADFVKEWAGTDEGKAYLTAPNNSGGGAGGGSRGGSGKTMSESDFNALPAKERSAFMSEGGTISQPA